MPRATSLNAADYGLVSSASDQTAHLQAAIDAAQVRKLPLFIPAGIFKIRALRITAPVEIYCAPDGAVLEGYGQGPSIHVAPTTAGHRFGPVSIRGLTMDGQGQAFPEGPYGGLIKTREIDRLTVEGCTLRNSAAQAIYLDRTAGWIRDNIVESARDCGVCSSNAATNGVIIDANNISNSGNTGIRLTRDRLETDRSSIINNTVSVTTAAAGGNGANGNGINVYRAGNVTISGNKISDSAFSAIRLNASSGSQVIGNYCFSSREVALYVEAPGEGEPFLGGVVADNIIDDCGTGISIANTNNGGRRVVVSGNQITHAVNRTVTYPGGSYQTFGRGIEADGDVIVTHNQLESIADWGILAHASNYGVGKATMMVLITDNMIKTCGGGIAFHNEDFTYGRIMIGGNMIDAFTTTAQYAAIVPVDWNGATGIATKISGTADLGNATSSGFANVKLLPNFSFR
jgi:uncharacterized secreted repeat protein (TIGR03808 family)